MRTATIVLVAYVLCLIVATVWRYLPGLVTDAVPAVGALTAAYLGHTSRPFRAPATAGAVVLGYLIDVISGTPIGLTALVLAITTAVARTAQQRIFVRGTAMTIGFSGFIAVVTSLIAIVVSAIAGLPRPTAFGTELGHIVLVAVTTALAGPLVWKLFRRIDAAFARTHRDREAVLEGLTP
jgi:rod shape-determining protein MreD